jgi:glutamine amidotransferase
MPIVCLIDYGAGNLHSAERGLMRAAPDASWKVVVSAEPETLLAADRLVLPGVGAFASCAKGLRARKGLEEAIHGAVDEKQIPFLGICVGMQLLADRGLEHGETKGLGLIAGTVRPLKNTSLRLPHMGWNDVVARRAHPALPEDGDAYFVHSFAFDAANENDVLATCDYSETFPAVIGRNNILGAQFHPEKSGEYGQAFLRKFLEWQR